jgi:CBS domain-containing membrane protein
LSKAAAIMLEHRVGCLPVVDKGELVGILTEGDFLRLATLE